MFEKQKKLIPLQKKYTDFLLQLAVICPSSLTT
jgi:hypothetical protein